MQTVKIGESKAIIFFDLCAIIHIIDGSLAERDRVAESIQVLRESLKKLGVDTTLLIMCMQWNNLFSRISNTLDN